MNDHDYRCYVSASDSVLTMRGPTKCTWPPHSFAYKVSLGTADHVMDPTQSAFGRLKYSLLCAHSLQCPLLHHSASRSQLIRIGCSLLCSIPQARQLHDSTSTPEGFALLVSPQRQITVNRNETAEQKQQQILVGGCDICTCMYRVFYF